MSMDSTISTTNGTKADSISVGSLNGLLFKALVFLLSSSAFWVAISVAVLIHFILTSVFRPKKNESRPKFHPEIENLCDYNNRYKGLDYIWEHNHETIWNSFPENYQINDPHFADELASVNSIHGDKSDCSEDSQKLTSSLSFKFEHQTSEEHKMLSVKEKESPVFNQLPTPDNPPISNEPISSNIQKYQFAPERNLRGFVQEPEIMTISVNELSAELEVKKLAIKEERLNINLDGETEKLGLVKEPKPQYDIQEEPKLGLELSSKPESQSETKVIMAGECESLPELKQECELTQVVNLEQGPQKEQKYEPEHEQESESESESEPELKQEPELEPEPEQEPEPEPEQEPELEPEPEPKSELKLEPELEYEHAPTEGIRHNIQAKPESDQSEGSGGESWGESNPVYTNYEETNKPTDLGPNISSSINKDIAVPVQKISNGGSFEPTYETTESETVPVDSEIPLEMPKRLSKKTAPVSNRRKLATRKKSKQQEMILEKPKLSSSTSPSTVSSGRRRRMKTRRYVSAEFSDFDSDSLSSMSDGYSVKDLVVDSDSDWFLSEKESDIPPHKTCNTEESTNLVKFASELMDHLRGIENNQPKSFYGSETDSSNSSIQTFYNHNQPNQVKAWLEDSSRLEIDVQTEEEVKTKAPDESVGLEIKGIKETNINIESDRSLEKIVITNQDRDLETRRNSLGQDNEAACKDLDREIHTGTLDQHEDISPRKDYASEETMQDAEETDKQQSKSKEKGKEYLDEEEEDELESLWEHQDLIEQLKMEIKKAKAIGLPTILEESETPKASIEEMKAWHFDEKFLREDPMDELNKFYKSYRERMRKFDILNYQKMYAVGFLQLKDPLESMGSQKPLLPKITSILSQNIYRRRKSTDDPSERFIKELRCDLEMVYVGQMCLSWEFLRWQYEKACELPETDSYHSHRYNQTAGEFQQFQVLVNRFLENEPFQGPRLPNYVKNRCVLRNLLQVPVIKEDSTKEKYEDDRKGNYSISSEELEDIMVESIRVFWEFVKADKDATPVILKGLVGPQAELQDPSDYDLMIHLNSILQKKEKRLKDLLKTGNCLIKKFKKAKEDRSNEDQFFSQVDIKLVSRVLKMPKISSEQLQWCQKKLDKITFVNRKIRREPAFLLFPC